MKRAQGSVSKNAGRYTADKQRSGIADKSETEQTC